MFQILSGLELLGWGLCSQSAFLVISVPPFQMSRFEVAIVSIYSPLCSLHHYTTLHTSVVPSDTKHNCGLLISVVLPSVYLFQVCLLASKFTWPENATELCHQFQAAWNTFSWCFLTSLWQLTMIAASVPCYLIGYWRLVIKTSAPSLVRLSQSVKQDEASSAIQTVGGDRENKLASLR